MEASYGQENCCWESGNLKCSLLWSVPNCMTQPRGKYIFIICKVMGGLSTNMQSSFCLTSLTLLNK